MPGAICRLVRDAIAAEQQVGVNVHIRRQR
jgi:hypothetical protein